jgi:hypothetical protein
MARPVSKMRTNSYETVAQPIGLVSPGRGRVGLAPPIATIATIGVAACLARVGLRPAMIPVFPVVEKEFIEPDRRRDRGRTSQSLNLRRGSRSGLPTGPEKRTGRRVHRAGLPNHQIRLEPPSDHHEAFGSAAHLPARPDALWSRSLRSLDPRPTGSSRRSSDHRPRSRLRPDGATGPLQFVAHVLLISTRRHSRPMASRPTYRHYRHYRHKRQNEDQGHGGT